MGRAVSARDPSKPVPWIGRAIDPSLPPLKACLDVHYRDEEAVAACVLFGDWRDHRGETEVVRHVPAADLPPYRAGELYRRELPCLLAVLASPVNPLELVLVDGYVWLEEGRPGLGGHLFRELGERIPVVGVAKSVYPGAEGVVEVHRGRSQRPVYVSAAGVDVHTAASLVKQMHGSHRIPTLLRRADRLSREG